MIFLLLLLSLPALACFVGWGSVWFTAMDEGFLLLPCISLSDARCSSCEETHGWAIHYGWAIWTLSFVFTNDPHES